MRSSEVCEATGATYRNLDYWIRAGYLGDPADWLQGSGSQRRFGPRDVEVVRALVALSPVLDPKRSPMPRVAAHVREHGLRGRVELAPHVVLLLDGVDGGKAGGTADVTALRSAVPHGRDVEPRFKGAKK